MGPEVRERFERIESNLDRMNANLDKVNKTIQDASSLMVECVQNYYQMTKSLSFSFERLDRIEKMQEENAKQQAQNTKDIAELKEMIRLSLERPRNGH